MFERKREYAYEVKTRPGGYLQVVYTADHPSGAVHLETGEYVGQFVCAKCSDKVSHLYRHKGAWKCPSCKDSDTPKKPARQKRDAGLFDSKIGR